MENMETLGRTRNTQILVECVQNVCQKAGFPASKKGSGAGLRVGGVALLFSGGALRISA